MPNPNYAETTVRQQLLTLAEDMAAQAFTIVHAQIDHDGALRQELARALTYAAVAEEYGDELLGSKENYDAILQKAEGRAKQFAETAEFKTLINQAPEETLHAFLGVEENGVWKPAPYQEFQARYDRFVRGQEPKPDYLNLTNHGNYALTDALNAVFTASSGPRTWQSEEEKQNVFNAIALAQAYYSVSDRIRNDPVQEGRRDELFKEVEKQAQEIRQTPGFQAMVRDALPHEVVDFVAKETDFTGWMAYLYNPRYSFDFMNKFDKTIDGYRERAEARERERLEAEQRAAAQEEPEPPGMSDEEAAALTLDDVSVRLFGEMVEIGSALEAEGKSKLKDFCEMDLGLSLAGNEEESAAEKQANVRQGIARLERFLAREVPGLGTVRDIAKKHGALSPNLKQYIKRGKALAGTQVEELPEDDLEEALNEGLEAQPANDAPVEENRYVPAQQSDDEPEARQEEQPEEQEQQEEEPINREASEKATAPREEAEQEEPKPTAPDEDELKPKEAKQTEQDVAEPKQEEPKQEEPEQEEPKQEEPEQEEPGKEEPQQAKAQPEEQPADLAALSKKLSETFQAIAGVLSADDWSAFASTANELAGSFDMYRENPAMLKQNLENADKFLATDLLRGSVRDYLKEHSPDLVGPGFDRLMDRAKELSEHAIEEQKRAEEEKEREADKEPEVYTDEYLNHIGPLKVTDKLSDKLGALQFLLGDQHEISLMGQASSLSAEVRDCMLEDAPLKAMLTSAKKVESFLREFEDKAPDTYRLAQEQGLLDDNFRKMLSWSQAFAKEALEEGRDEEERGQEENERVQDEAGRQPEEAGRQPEEAGRQPDEAERQPDEPQQPGENERVEPEQQPEAPQNVPPQPAVTKSAARWIEQYKADFAARREELTRSPGYPMDIMANIMAAREIVNSKRGKASTLGGELTQQQITKRANDLKEDPTFQNFVKAIKTIPGVQGKVDSILQKKHSHGGELDDMFRDYVLKRPAGKLPNNAPVLDRWLPTVKDRVEWLQKDAKAAMKDTANPERQADVYKAGLEIVLLRTTAGVERGGRGLDRKVVLSDGTLDKPSLTANVNSAELLGQFKTAVDSTVGKKTILAGHGGKMTEAITNQVLHPENLRVSKVKEHDVPVVNADKGLNKYIP